VGRSRVTGGSAGGGFDPRILLGAGAILVIAVGAYVLTGGFGGSGAGASPSPGGTPYAPVARASNPPGCPTAQPSPEPSGQTPTVTINTSKGAIVIKADGSPIATGNFVALAQCGFYNGLVFHRLVPGFVIQGGDPNGDGTGGPGYTIADEVVTGTYKAGTVAMARTQQPNSQGSQFFIVLADSAASTLSQANPGYAIVGEVTSGMDVVNAIAAMPNSGQPDNAALQPVTMTSVTVSP
jgi:peptidyl-prolyl cis-trans isomerase B (cyclophilin B)